MNKRQEVFVQEYLKDFNATRAAKVAGYSEKTAYSIGQENLKKPEIAEAIRAEISTRAMGADEVLTRLADIARGDVADLMDITPVGFNFNLLVEDENGNKVPNPKTKLIKKIKQKVTTYSARKEDGEDREIVETEVELLSPLEALQTLAKRHGLLVDRAEVSGPGGGAIPLETFNGALGKVYGGDSGSST